MIEATNKGIGRGHAHRLARQVLQRGQRPSTRHFVVLDDDQAFFALVIATNWLVLSSSASPQTTQTRFCVPFEACHVLMESLLRFMRGS